MFMIKAAMVSFGILALGTSGVARAQFRESTSEVEVPVQALLAPAEGFDDNDNIQVVLHGSLPNGCYLLGNYKAEQEAGTQKYKVKQFALRRYDGVCADQAHLPEHLKMAIPFMTEVGLGQLPAGSYEFDFDLVNGAKGIRTMAVGSAQAPSIDSLPYAIVSNVFSRDIVSASDNLEVTLSGTLNSSCTELDRNVKVLKEKDVFVILPIIKVKEGVICQQVMRPYQYKVNLGKAAPGHYLVHTRSMSGKAVNKVVLVTR